MTLCLNSSLLSQDLIYSSLDMLFRVSRHLFLQIVLSPLLYELLPYLSSNLFSISSMLPLQHPRVISTSFVKHFRNENTASVFVKVGTTNSVNSFRISRIFSISAINFTYSSLIVPMYALCCHSLVSKNLVYIDQSLDFSFSEARQRLLHHRLYLHTSKLRAFVQLKFIFFQAYQIRCLLLQSTYLCLI